jgi:hypothetical protein
MSIMAATLLGGTRTSDPPLRFSMTRIVVTGLLVCGVISVSDAATRNVGVYLLFVFRQTAESS